MAILIIIIVVIDSVLHLLWRVFLELDKRGWGVTLGDSLFGLHYRLLTSQEWEIFQLAQFWQKMVIKELLGTDFFAQTFASSCLDHEFSRKSRWRARF